MPPTIGGIATWAGILRSQCTLADHSFQFVEIPGRPTGGHLKWVFQSLRSVLLVARVVKEIFSEHPDILHVNCCLSALGIWRDVAMAGMASACRVPVVVHYRGSLPDVVDRLPTHSRLGLRLLIRLATVNIGITRGSVNLLTKQVGERKTVHLPNFIEDEWLFRPSANMIRERRSPQRCRLQAIYVGRLSREKGTLDLVRVADSLPNIDFLLVGNILEEVGPAIKGASSNVKAIGEISRPEVMEQFFSSDLLIFPSHREGFPNTVVEAMAAGLPVVSTRVGSVGDMVEEGRGGWLVAPADVCALRDAVDRLSADPELMCRMGEYNRQVCLKKFAFSAVFPILAAVYERLQSQSRRETFHDG